MNGIDKLELRVYTYKELCELFGQERKKAHSKDAQLREWACYFSWENLSTQKFLVTEIYEIPYEKEDRRKNNGGHITSKFLAMDDVLISYLQEAKTFTGTSTKLLVEVGVLSDIYRESQYAQHGVVQQGFPSYVVSNFFAAVRNCVHKSLHVSLERLERKGYVAVQSYFVLRLRSGAILFCFTPA